MNQIFRPLQENVFEILVRDHLDNFLASATYNKLVRSGRSSLLLMADVLVVKGHNSPQTSIYAAPSLKGSLSQNLKELKHFILSEHDNIFGNYLHKFSEIVMMYFCQSCLRFKEANFPADMDRVNAAGAIYERLPCVII